MPHVFSGLKVAITLAVIGAIVAEVIGADKGLGYLILTNSGASEDRGRVRRSGDPLGAWHHLILCVGWPSAFCAVVSAPGG